MSDLNINLHKARFLQSCHNMGQWPNPAACEIAFVGRSNAGKSSTINTLCQQQNLAKTSKTPGRTRLINFFAVDENLCLTDLPGYGYAAMSSKEAQQIQHMLLNYLRVREQLCGIVLIMDIRRDIKQEELAILDLAFQRNLPVHFILSKSDKLSNNEKLKRLTSIKKSLSNLPNIISMQAFSSLKRLGLDDAQEVINSWVNAHLET